VPLAFVAFFVSITGHRTALGSWLFSYQMSGIRRQAPGSKVQRSKFQRFDNSKNKSDVMSNDRGYQPAT
jgi:hypothetical protein